MLVFCVGELCDNVIRLFLWKFIDMLSMFIGGSSCCLWGMRECGDSLLFLIVVCYGVVFVICLGRECGFVIIV